MANRTATIKTGMGEFTVELFEERAPATTKNFIDLAEKNFYDGVIFHRVIEGFMLQGGDPTGTGRGGPGYNIDCEHSPDARHTKAGMLSMANRGPDTNGSQFFITLGATPHLDGRHTVFGEIVEGMDIIEKIGATQTGAGDRPLSDITIDGIDVVRA
jgi:cyclophilin family peptidyl-prolyl cis-trans isomerase